MGEHVERLLALTAPGAGPRPDAAELRQLQLAAANERLAEQRAAIPVLDRRAREAGRDEIASHDDLVPLLFAHSVYKSYPESFLVDGRWDRMSRWLDTITTSDVTAI